MHTKQQQQKSFCIIVYHDVLLKACPSIKTMATLRPKRIKPMSNNLTTFIHHHFHYDGRSISKQQVGSWWYDDRHLPVLLSNKINHYRRSVSARAHVCVVDKKSFLFCLFVHSDGQVSATCRRNMLRFCCNMQVIRYNQNGNNCCNHGSICKCRQSW